MPLYLTITGLAAAALLSLFFASLTYSLREFSRARLAEFLGRNDGDHWYETLTEHTADLAFVTAVCRQFSNLLIFVLVFSLLEHTAIGRLARYAITIAGAGSIAVFFSVALPHAIARYAGAEVVGFLRRCCMRCGLFFRRWPR